MGRFPDESKKPLLGGSKDPYSFMYPGSGSISTLSLNGNPEGTEEQVLTGIEEKIDLSGQELVKVKKIDGSDEHKLGELLSTAICGNDITSSIFYTSALCTASAGRYAPISLSIVCVVLYLFRKVYGEVGSALPLNGGAYNVLLNTTSKQVASLAAALTMISYMATAVVSANSAMGYLQVLWPGVSVYWATIILLGFFAALNLVGISESAVVAFGIFVIHMITLAIFVFGGFIIFFKNKNWTVFLDNLHGVNPPDTPAMTCSDQVYFDRNFAYSIFFGFGAAMLGVTGFETSSNFIEQQEQGVFPKTLRNMWFIVTLFNPLIGLLNLCFLPACTIANTQTGVLSLVAETAFGKWFQMWVGIDAVLVLSGSVITSYVGVIGLVRRMALDRVLPQFLIQVNPCRKTPHWIIVLFFIICSSLFVIVDGNLDTLSGVYTVAFLGVMSLFAIGNMLLKYKRSSLKRDIQSPWVGTIIAFISVIAGLTANIIREDSIVFYFGIYFGVTACIIGIMFIRARLLKMIVFFVQLVIPSRRLKEKFTNALGKAINDINSQPIIFFASKSDPAYLNKAILYIRDNEQTNWVKIVHCHDQEDGISESFSSNIEFLDSCYPKIRVDLIKVNAPFNPSTVERVSILMDIPKNFMFVACPKDQDMPHSIGDFGGVRMITH
ncbi:hypothetical protein CYY_000332 [Polysphondylium violaceum]|uniref:Amino acid permease n=1 Tax=Polysphondylium violaceum TaxID=133409 RepID=A0A8J4PZY3_9MYCE|nr:hypothetical protein CYY_000332 [Polysphondylium violaceum]